MGDVWVRDRDPILTRDAFQALQDAPWYGLGFSAREDAQLGWLPGTFSHQSVSADHPRAPDVRGMFAHDDQGNVFGVTGRG